jgi:hypothetical protein
MPDRPRAADDFATIRKRMEEVNNEQFLKSTGTAAAKRPHAADDFDTIRTAKANLGLKGDIAYPKA